MSAPVNLRLTHRLALPAHYRSAEFFAFHRRDPQGVSERIDDGALHKGLLWRGRAAGLVIRLRADHAEVMLDVDAASPDVALAVSSTDVSAPIASARPDADDQAALVLLTRRMLGLTQAVDVFEHRYRGHPELGSLIAARPGLRVPQTATPFDALTWAVTGQQISVAVAVSLRRRLIQAAGLPHSSGLICPPDAARVAALSDDTLRAAGFSTAKSATLRTLARLVVDGALPLEHWLQTLPVDEIRAGLLAVRGIGPWTVDYALLRGFGWLDGSLHGDVAVRGALQSLLQSPDRIDEKHTRVWLDQFSPWRALVAAHLWASRSAMAY